MDDSPKPGDHVVHAVHGPGEVVAVQVRDTPDGPVEYVTMQVEDMRIMIPTAELDEVGIREPMSADEARDVLQLLGEDPMKDPGHTPRRRRNRSRLTGGDAEELAKVIRSLRALRVERDKGLALHDRGHLDNATEKLVSELAIALDVSEAEALEMVDEAVRSNLDED